MQEFWKKSAFSGVLLIKTAALKQTKILRKKYIFFKKNGLKIWKCQK